MHRCAQKEEHNNWFWIGTAPSVEVAIAMSSNMVRHGCCLGGSLCTLCIPWIAVLKKRKLRPWWILDCPKWEHSQRLSKGETRRRIDEHLDYGDGILEGLTHHLFGPLFDAAGSSQSHQKSWRGAKRVGGIPTVGVRPAQLKHPVDDEKVSILTSRFLGI